MNKDNIREWRDYVNDEGEVFRHPPQNLLNEVLDSYRFLLEAQMSDIESQTNRIIIKRGIKRIDNPDPYGQEISNPDRHPKIKLVRADPKRGIWTFRVPGCRSQGSTVCPENSKMMYTTKLKGLKRGNISSDVKDQKKGNIKKLQHADVQVLCDCPYFKWGGPEYNAKRGNYLYQKTADGTASEPNIRDPERVNLVCKHIIAVFDILKKYPFFID